MHMSWTHQQDFADIDVIRVGDTHYASVSTMHYSPGAPVLRSYGLVNWEIAYVAYGNTTISVAQLSPDCREQVCTQQVFTERRLVPHGLRGRVPRRPDACPGTGHLGPGRPARPATRERGMGHGAPRIPARPSPLHPARSPR